MCTYSSFTVRKAAAFEEEGRTSNREEARQELASGGLVSKRLSCGVHARLDPAMVVAGREEHGAERLQLLVV